MKRYQIDVPEDGVREIDRMKEAIRARTNGELFDNALTLLDWAIVNVQQGRLIVSMSADESSHRILTMPALEKARRAEEDVKSGAAFSYAAATANER